MRLTRSALALLVVALIAAAAPRLAADVVVTIDGSRIVGKVSKIHAGVVFVSTDYAGDLQIKQAKVVSITTDKPVAVRLDSGTRIDGVVTTAPSGAVQVAGADGVVTTAVPKVASSWAAGTEDPDVVALRRHWAFEADVDINGKTGNTSQLGTDLGFRAKLIGPTDTLQFYSAYNRQVTGGQKSADQFKAGIDYEDNFTDRTSWYVRDEAGFDRVMDIRFSDVAASGLGYDVIKIPNKETLTFRAGISYRYDEYIIPQTANVSAVGADFEIEHQLKLHNLTLSNRLAFVPEFQDTSNFIINHESAVEIPLSVPWWHLKVGLQNDYNSKPGAGVHKLDTTYFTRLVLKWGQ
jgi:putative salt-induced outer membrane protein YdiY